MKAFSIPGHQKSRNTPSYVSPSNNIYKCVLPTKPKKDIWDHGQAVAIRLSHGVGLWPRKETPKCFETESL